jgi:hypothetical protein
VCGSHGGGNVDCTVWVYDVVIRVCSSDVSEEHITSIFRAEVKMKAVSFSEIFVTTYKYTLAQITAKCMIYIAK